MRRVCVFMCVCLSRSARVYLLSICARMRGEWAKERKQKWRKKWKMNWSKLFMVESQANQITCHCAPTPLQPCTAWQPACVPGAAAEGFLHWLVIHCVFLGFFFFFFTVLNLKAPGAAVEVPERARTSRTSTLTCYVSAQNAVCEFAPSADFLTASLPRRLGWFPSKGSAASHTDTSLSLVRSHSCCKPLLKYGAGYWVYIQGWRVNIFTLYLSDMKAKGLRMGANQDVWLFFKCLKNIFKNIDNSCEQHLSTPMRIWSINGGVECHQNDEWRLQLSHNCRLDWLKMWMSYGATMILAIYMHSVSSSAKCALP